MNELHKKQPKPENDVVLHLRLNRSLKEKVSQEARKNNRSITQHVAFILRQGVSDPVCGHMLDLKAGK